MTPSIVLDSTCLIALERIGRLDLLLLARRLGLPITNRRAPSYLAPSYLD